jgi:hypothetical protein
MIDLGETPPAVWGRMFARLASALPGLGGPQGYDDLTGDEVAAIVVELEAIERERAAALASR